MSEETDRVVDVVVLGSGFAGLAAAAVAHEEGCEVEILERTELLGGTSAWSGGQLWVPVNGHMSELGVEDSRDDALTYLLGLTKGREPDSELLETFVDTGGEAIEYLEANTPLSFIPSRGYSDYFANTPGGKPEGRSLDPLPYPARDELGEWFSLLRVSPHIPLLTMTDMAGIGTAFDPKSGAMSGPGENVGVASPETIIAERERKGERVNGAALVAPLLRAVRDREIPLRTGVRARKLLVEDGRVVGVEADHDGEPITIRARRGVVVACGGFEWNPELVKSFLGVPELRPLSPPVNDGDGLLMGLEVGAATANMSVAWAIPVTSDSVSTLEGQPVHVMSTPRMEAGCIVVNREGRRFANEAVSYMDFPRLHRNYDPITATYPNEPPVWMIFDDVVRQTIVINDFRPNEPVPAWVHEAGTLQELAALIEVDPDTLSAELTRFNGLVDDGVDRDFGRGTVWFEGWRSGGPSPEAALKRVEHAPFYAMPLYDGALGTAGGLSVDGHGRVRATRGGVVPGLYACGNAAASVFGPAYPGGGATLGQHAAFAYLVGRHLGAEQSAELPHAQVGS